MKNSAYHSGIKRSPYTAMFGTELKVGLTSSSLPSEIIDKLQTEDDLLTVLNTPRKLQNSKQLATMIQTLPLMANSEKKMSLEILKINNQVVTPFDSPTQYSLTA